MLDVHIKGLEQAIQDLKDFSERRVKAAAATAMTRTTVKVRKEVQQHAKKVFSNPSPFTLRALKYIAATAKEPWAAVGFNIEAVQDSTGKTLRFEDLGPGMTPAGKYLQFQIDGGRRNYKRFEKALQAVGVLPTGWYCVPGERAKLDAFGNHSAGEIRQILSWFDAAELVQGSRQNMGNAGRERRRKGTARKAGWEYFIVVDGMARTWQRKTGGIGRRRMQPGIYRRTFLAMGSRIEPVIIFVRGAPGYKPRFDFYGVAQRVADQNLGQEFSLAIAEHRQRVISR